MLLTPYTAIDLTGPLGSLAGRILADLGADVIKVEPPGGDPARGYPPFLHDDTRPPLSVSWAVLNANKRGITLDLESSGDRAALRELIAGADFLLETFAPGYLASLELDYPRLRAINPRLILVSITPFGQTGPYCRWLASDLEIMAVSAAMSLAGEAGGEPMRVTLPAAPLWAGTEAAMGALTALVHRTMRGDGQHVDVSAQAAMVSALIHAPVFYDMNGVVPERAGVYITGRSTKGAKMRALWPCRDGWINFIIYGGAAGRHTNQQLVEWMTAIGLAPDWLRAIDWARFDATALTQDEVDRLETPIARFMESVTKQEFLEGAIARQMLGYPVFTMRDILQDRQLQARDFWEEVEDAAGTALRLPGSFALVDGWRLPIRRAAPSPGEHNDEVLADLSAREPARRDG